MKLKQNFQAIGFALEVISFYLAGVFIGQKKSYLFLLIGFVLAIAVGKLIELDGIEKYENKKIKEENNSEDAESDN